VALVIDVLDPFRGSGIEHDGLELGEDVERSVEQIVPERCRRRRAFLATP
jgi:hypothetical protein